MISELISPMPESAFHFSSLVWDWPIAIYLFLVGISSGMVFISILLKRYVLKGDISNSGFIKATAIIAPSGVVLGLLLLIHHLARPWTFWKLMFFYSHTSVMSMGVLLFQVYMLTLIVWLIFIFRKMIIRQLMPYKKLKVIHTYLDKYAFLEQKLESFLLIFSVLLGAYTGFLLSALKSYPLLNNPILPVLFLFSGISSGIATLILSGVVCFKESIKSKSMAFLHKCEGPVVLLEMFLLLCFFTGSYFGGGQKAVAADVALFTNFWSVMFWVFVVGTGLIIPLLLNLLSNDNLKHSKNFILTLSAMSLFGVLILRFVILYTGQMTIA